MVAPAIQSQSQSHNLFAASRQWAVRPADERFWTVADMHGACRRYADSAVLAEGVDPSTLRFEPAGQEVMGYGESGERFHVTHHAFGQVCASAGAPADYMRRLPAERASELLTWHFSSPEARNGRDLTARDILLHGSSRGVLARALTSERYERIWNYEVCEVLERLVSDGWRVPPGRRPYGATAEGIATRAATIDDVITFRGSGGIPVQVGDQIAPSGLYASDHDMFAFLVNPKRVIEDGSDGGLMPGVIISNSEVGGTALSVMTFYLRAVCGNHIIWGAKNVREKSIRHAGRARSKWADAIDWVHYNAGADLLRDQAAIKQLQAHKLGLDSEEVLETVHSMRVNGLTLRDVQAAYDTAASHPEDGDPRSAWGLVQGLTRVSQMSPFADKRARLDEAAGKVLLKVRL